MTDETLSQHCQMLGEPGRPGKSELPTDCPPGAAYVNFKTDEPANVVINGNAPFPVVFQGGDDNDTFKVVGDNGNVIIFGGKGDDSMELQSDQAWVIEQLSGTVSQLGTITIILASIGLAFWLLKWVRETRTPLDD